MSSRSGRTTNELPHTPADLVRRKLGPNDEHDQCDLDALRLAVSRKVANEPCVTLELDGAAEPHVYAMSLDDLRSLAASAISVLANSGDEIARAIGERYFDRFEPGDPDDEAAASWRDQPPLL